MSAAEPSRLARLPAWVDALLIALMTAGIYAQGHRHLFITFDDALYVVGNARVLEGYSWSNFIWAWSNFDAANYHPLTWLSYMLDIELFGLRPGWMVIENAVFHAINGWLVARVLQTLGLGRASALLAALAFTAHPLQVESVAWIAQRKTVLGSMFGLMAVLLYLRRARRNQPPANWHVLALLSASLLSKAWFVTAPALFLVIDIWILGRQATLNGRASSANLLRRTWPLLREKVPMGGLVICISIATVLSQNSSGAIATTDVVPVLLRFQNAAVSCVTYISDAVRLGGFSLFYPFPESLPTATVAGCLGLLVTITAVLVARQRDHGPLLAGWLWFLLFLLPVIGLIQVGGQARADRYMYMPLVGLMWAMAHMGEQAWERLRPTLRPILSTAAILWVLALGAVAFRQTGLWRNTFGIVGHSITVSGPGPRLLSLLGVAYLQIGRWETAMSLFERSLREDNQNSTTALNLAITYSETGRMQAAIDLTEQVAALEPNNYVAYRNLAHFYRLTGDEEKARKTEAALTAIERKPGAYFTRPSKKTRP